MQPRAFGAVVTPGAAEERSADGLEISARCAALLPEAGEFESRLERRTAERVGRLRQEACVLMSQKHFHAPDTARLDCDVQRIAPMRLKELLVLLQCELDHASLHVYYELGSCQQSAQACAVHPSAVKQRRVPVARWVTIIDVR